MGVEMCTPPAYETAPTPNLPDAVRGSGFSFHKQATHDWGGKSSYFLKDCNNDLLNAVQAHKDEEIKIDKIVNPLIMKIRGKRSL